MRTILVEGRSVGKSTDLGAGLAPWRDLEAESSARVEFIRTFPKLSPLLYSIPIEGPEPVTVEGWLTVIQHELDHAHASRRDNVAFDLAINTDMVGEG